MTEKKKKKKKLMRKPMKLRRVARWSLRARVHN
jgi:hypothetical protein